MRPTDAFGERRETEYGEHGLLSGFGTLFPHP